MDADVVGRRLVVSYHGLEAAGTVADGLVDGGVPREFVVVGAVRDLAVVGRGAQRVEARHASVGVPLATGLVDEQTWSGWIWSALGFVAGFVPFLVFGLFVDVGDLPSLGGAALVGICGGLGGAAVGVVYGLARGPEHAGVGRVAPPSSVLSVPADALGDLTALLALLRTGPVASTWIVAGGAAPVRDRLTRPPSDHPSALPDGPGGDEA